MVLADLGRSINAALNGLVRPGENVDAAALDALLNEISMALLREDVGLKQVGRLTTNVRKAVNLKDQPPAQAKRMVQKAVFDELVKLVDAGREAPKPKKGRTNVIMFVGLQGAGKTTTCTKFAVYYSRRGFRVGLVCADTFRAGAFDQLKQNASRAKIPYYGSYTEPDPVEVARAGVEKFTKEGFDLIIVDTSGRHRQEAELFDEMVQIGNAVNPTQTLMVLDASIGQAAELQARAFKDASNFGGIVLTKMDGHAKGGGAISAVAATETPIAFIGTGEHVHDLETFAPQQFVGKLLGIGDLQGLMEQVQTLNLDQKSTMKNIQQGIFTLRDLRAQMTNIMKLGPLSKVASMIPGMSGLADQLGGEGGDSDDRLKKMVYMTDSMTEQELDSDGSLFEREPTRVVRVARGSGTSVQTVQELLFQQKMMAGMAKRMGGKDGFMSKMQALQSGKGGGPQMDAVRRKMQQMGMDPQTGAMANGAGGMPGMPGMPDMSQMFGGGMPDMSQMMNMVNQNPMLKNMMKQFGGQ